MRDLNGIRKGLKLSTSIGMVLVATGIVAVAPAMAQTTAAPAVAAAAADAETVNQIVVTGTRVVRDGFKSPTPLTCLLYTSPSPRDH
jgi:iron complex outermembrane receptor protein